MSDLVTDGFLNIAKPPGMTSHDVVSYLRRILSIKKAGHLGTLDPGASGVLPVATGRATRLIEYMAQEIKGYRVEMTLGIETDTYDAFGEVTRKKNLESFDFSALEASLKSFAGIIAQTPPSTSSIHVNGKRLYEYHRSGIPVTAPSRQVRIDSIEIVEFKLPLLILDVTCGPGTYMRSLCRDIGLKLGCGAYMSFLVRFRSGRFMLDEALTPSEIEIYAHRGEIASVLISPGDALESLSSFMLEHHQADRIRKGMRVILPSEAPICGNRDRPGEQGKKGEKVTLLSLERKLIAVGEIIEDSPLTVRPLKVLTD